MTSVPGYHPVDLQLAYNVPTGGPGQLVAIVDAYDDPNAESDLGVYRSQFGLSSCTTANGCFKKVNQSGGTDSYPAPNGGWAQEISLDLDMVSAICPNCHILLVEANSNHLSDLGVAVNTAAQLGAKAISNSYGSSEYSSETTDESTYFNHPGLAITASSGDGGYGVEFPAASQYVTAAGGTTLSRASNARGWSETVWSGAGSGCSAYITKPAYQTDAGCSDRTVADVAADADPGTGVAVYDSFRYQGLKGWLVFGGTSVASPIISALYALADNTSGSYPADPYQKPSALFDVTSGSNGSCGGSYLCNGEPGYDGPTGLGTPNGTSAFANPTVSVSPTTVSAGGPVIFTWSNVANPTSTDWVGLYHPGASNGLYLDYFWTNSCSSSYANSNAVGSGSCSYTMPYVGATYELRLFSSNTYTLLGTSSSIADSGPAASGAISATPSSVAPGGSVTVSWTNRVTATKGDGFGLYHPGDSDYAPIDWIWDDTCSYAMGTTAVASGSCSYTMPASGGSYEFRLFSNNSYIRLAVSNSVSVGATASAAPTTSTTTTTAPGTAGSGDAKRGPVHSPSAPLWHPAGHR